MTTLDALFLDMDFSLFTTLTQLPGITGTHEEHYAALLDFIERADSVGFEAAFVAEHHCAGKPQASYPLVPNPAVMLAAAAMRTKKMRLGPGVSILPFRNPLQVVEDYAMVDQLSGGRLIMGVGSGDPGLTHELEGYCIPSDERIPRYMECLKLIESAWSGCALTYDGEFYSFQNASPNVGVRRTPPPPIHVAVSRPEAVYAVARHGYPIYAVPYSGVSNIIQHYREGRKDADLPYSADMHYFMFNTFVAQTDRELRQKFEDAARLTRTNPNWAKLEGLVEAGNALVGTVDTVVDQLVDLHQSGVRKVMLCLDYRVGLSWADVNESMDLFVTEVAPGLAARLQGANDTLRVAVA